jgi:hypothetical protein
VKIENADVGALGFSVWKCSAAFWAAAVHDFSPSKTIHYMIVNHSGGLHVRIADRRADKFESALLQVFAQRI